MGNIKQLSPHVANLIAAGEVVERPASVIKELLENAVDAGATQVTVEIRDGGMTFMRVTDNGCGMSAEDARTAFLRHATSKLRNAEDLASISTMGFRGEALAAIASVSRIDLLTKTESVTLGTSLTLEAGNITEESEAGCPGGTTIIVRDLFFNTPARMKFMKSDTVEGSRVAAAVQQQALAHPEVSIRFLRDGKEVLSTPGNGNLEAAVYCVYGRESGKMIKVDSNWENCQLSGYVSKPTDARPSRNLQTFFVNDRPVKSRLLIAAFEEAYRNRIMIGKFPSCVLHLKLPANAVDVNVHPAKTEVKFLNEKAVFDCIHYGVLGALNKTPDRPQVQFKSNVTPIQPTAPTAPKPADTAAPGAKKEFFRTMNPEEFMHFTQTLQTAPQPTKPAAAAFAAAETQTAKPVVHAPAPLPILPDPLPVTQIAPLPPEQPEAPEPEQQVLSLPEVAPWRYVGELYNSYIIVEQGEEAFLIDKHAAHERILFDKLKKNQEAVTGQVLLKPLSCRMSPEYCGALLSNLSLLQSLGFDLEEFGDNTVLIRQIPMDLSPDQAADAVEELASNLFAGKYPDADSIRDEVLHTVACKAAIKAGWHTTKEEQMVLIGQVMAREDLKYCPHGRPICITLSKKQLEKQFKRS